MAEDAKEEQEYEAAPKLQIWINFQVFGNLLCALCCSIHPAPMRNTTHKAQLKLNNPKQRSSIVLPSAKVYHLLAMFPARNCPSFNKSSSRSEW